VAAQVCRRIPTPRSQIQKYADNTRQHGRKHPEN
jgi:hypothetical protein